MRALKSSIPDEKMPQILMGYDCFAPDLMDMIYKHIKSLWDEKKIKIAYVGYKKTYDMLLKAGVNCEYIKMSDEVIMHSINNIIRHVNLRDKYNNNSLVILINFTNLVNEDLGIDEIEYRHITLYKVIADYKRKYGKDKYINISHNSECVEINCYKNCEYECNVNELIDYISENFEFPYTIGIGIGNNLEICRDKAFKAMYFASQFGKNFSFSMENEMVKGPINSDYCLEFPIDFHKSNVEKAKKMNIEINNYTRVITLFKKYKNNITSGLISKYLNITMRSTNRIITELIDNNIIKEQDSELQQRGSEKGRPSRLYEIIEKSE